MLGSLGELRVMPSAPVVDPLDSPWPGEATVSAVTPTRVVFLVRPRGDAWEIAVGSDGACFLFDTRTEAVRRAKATALQHWEAKHEASGVRAVDRRGHLRTVAKFGP